MARLLFTLLLLGLLGGFVLPAPSGARLATGAGMPAAAPTACVPGWQILPAPGNRLTLPSLPDVNPESSGIAAVAARVPDDVWAVGRTVAAASRPLIAHWDGARWADVPGASTTLAASLDLVAIAGPDDIWGAGQTVGASGAEVFLGHWDGHRWQRPPLPLAPQQARVQVVSVLGPADIWALVVHPPPPDSPGRTASLLHWDGQRWELGPIPVFGVTDPLTALAARRAGDIWVGGGSPDGRLMIAHWDGARWIPADLRAWLGSPVTGIVARAAPDVWAVDLGGNILHWDGARWQAVAPPPADTARSYQLATSPGPRPDLWIAWQGADGAQAARWTGAGWAVLPATQMRIGRQHMGFAVAGPDEVWLTGAAAGNDFFHYANPCANQRSNPEATVRLFPETQRTLRGAFRQYWEAHGGLAVQGLPLTDEFREISALDGKEYTVQYFERAVFEYHPENASPYDVLLSQLGTYRYRRQYPRGAPGQRPNPTDTRFFPATGHAVGGRFRAYWEQQDGLAQFGYPLSEEFPERSALNGQVYTVQYFERAVFEYHPENRAPYDVLLSQLGTLRYQERYP